MISAQGLPPAELWMQPLDPLQSVGLSAAAAAIPLATVLVLMGGLRKSGLFASACGLAMTALLALFLWHMPLLILASSAVYGVLYALFPVIWIVFGALWLYNFTQDTGKFQLLRRWMEEHASTDPCIQVILVAFCFGALMEGTAGFGAPVAVTACLLVGLGLEQHKSVILALIANTAPVAFGSLGIPIVALAGVTGLGMSQLSSMVGRQVPFLSLVLPAYLVWVVARGRGLRRAWPAAAVAGGSYALAQFLVSNLWGPAVTDVVAAASSIGALMVLLKVWSPAKKADDIPAQEAAAAHLTLRESCAAWLPWAMLSLVIIAWSYLKVASRGQLSIPIPGLHNRVLISLYGRPYAAVYNFQALGSGTAVLVAVMLSALCLKASPGTVVSSGVKAAKQLRLPGLTVATIFALAYVYNYSGMAYTLGAAVAHAGPAFPLLSSYLGWVACFLSGSDTASNLLFGNLQVAAAHQLHLSPILLAATNSSGAVAGKMISPQNIAIGVTTVGLIGQEGKVLGATLVHSVFFAGLIGLIALAQAYWWTSMVPN